MSKSKFPLDKLPQLLKNPPHDKEIMLYDKNKKRRGLSPVKKHKHKLTLSELAEKIDNLGNDLRNEMNAGFKQVNERIDRIETRIDRIENRLDYNNLKKLPVDNK